MDVIHSLSTDHHYNNTAVTIGTFDGIHLGHQQVLTHLVANAKTLNSKSLVITFSNHPSTILKPTHPTPFICTPEHRLNLLKQLGIDVVCLLPFTQELSHQSADNFLHAIKKHLGCTSLVLGKDAHFGKHRHGDRVAIMALSTRLNLNVEYLEDLITGGQRISSSLIRQKILQGDFDGVAALLGRPYSIYGNVMPGHGRGAGLGFPTVNLCVEGLCLPPLGVYAVTLMHKKNRYAGVANLGVAPTMRADKMLLLEVHLWDRQLDLYGEAVEVDFHRYLRPEHHFNSVEELKQQIANDIETAKRFVNPQML